MREHDMVDVANMSSAEQLVKRALLASENGADVRVFWSTLRLGFRAYLDQNPIEARRPTQSSVKSRRSACDAMRRCGVLRRAECPHRLDWYPYPSRESGRVWRDGEPVVKAAGGV